VNPAGTTDKHLWIGQTGNTYIQYQLINGTAAHQDDGPSLPADGFGFLSMQFHLGRHAVEFEIQLAETPFPDGVETTFEHPFEKDA
jgi:hypothetical protein